MRLFLLLFTCFAVTFSPSRVLAQEVTSEPICFFVRNQADYKVYGSFITDYYTRPDGVRARHRSNFRLEEAGAIDKEKGHPLDIAEFCSYGPFYPERKLELVLRTLVPVFSCQTRVDQGEIIITGERNADNSGNITKAVCFE
jgi:hypothetical protein